MSKLQYQPPVANDEHYQPAPAESSGKSRAFQKFYDEPFVPIGIVATCFALGAASNSMRKGDRKNFNRFLRWRVAAQGLTVVAALAGSAYYAEERSQKKREEQLAAVQKSNERINAGIGKSEVIVTSAASQKPEKIATPVMDAVNTLQKKDV